MLTRCGTIYLRSLDSPCIRGQVKKIVVLLRLALLRKLSYELMIAPNRRTVSTFGYIQQFQPQRKRDIQ